MPSRSTSTIADACARRARFLSQYVLRMERRCRADADKNVVFSGAYVQYVAFFEAQLEQLFVGMLTGGLSHPNSAVKPVAQFSTSTVAKGIIFGGRNYVDWLPFEQHTAKRSGVFFQEGRPFSNLNAARRASLMRAGVLRNAIAHQSDHSLKQFEKHFVHGHAIPTQQQRPAGYLRGNFSLTQNRFQTQLIELVAVMNDLCS